MAKGLALDGHWCPRCETVKLPEAFYLRDTGKPDGWCKTCRLQRARERRLINPEPARKSQQKYYAELKNDPIALEIYREQHNEQRRKRNAQR